ncbi:transmembrane component nikq of energizing module of nickel ecf transporter [hydrocarbon metagenome]|uniref:Transmembrane component nikq of energizing module of nickel ecf transporter n=1 Tax=hydrocarbon metagenome TaxID=938273 RepID=A0A0W8FJJ8_9ZZZZ|nr:cobalt ECF transporter T component CbiQ [Methanomicrobiaceae archaeon]
MIDGLHFIERHAYGNSVIHRMDARVKLLVALTAIIAIVALPYSTMVVSLGAVLFTLFLALWTFSGLSPLVYIKRVVFILPFGFFLIFFQIFFTNRYYDTFHPLASLPFGITIYAESVEFALILLVKFLVSISFIILLSSTTRMQDMLDASRRFGLPAEFALTLGVMIRYLFVFAGMISRIRSALASRCFDPFDRRLPYRYRLQQLGYTIGMIFVRSYEQGERTYTSMLCRGYGSDVHAPVPKTPLSVGEISFLAGAMIFIVGSTVVFYL